ncbi:hypothetical protein BpHYR1_042468 [Brachionus plicatilis]|uniref:Uncharacterized protein n=1 Tax=Brachionus plicatilis TaxID=10195 RepID=A0A3M7S6K4_BRAPC|nr:hypothetical protein BpHYR1_042468 [Brachionus plicatilis]
MIIFLLIKLNYVSIKIAKNNISFISNLTDFSSVLSSFFVTKFKLKFNQLNKNDQKVESVLMNAWTAKNQNSYESLISLCV